MFRRERSRSDVFALEIAKKHLSLLYKSSLHFTNILFTLQLLFSQVDIVGGGTKIYFGATPRGRGTLNRL